MNGILSESLSFRCSTTGWLTTTSIGPPFPAGSYTCIFLFFLARVSCKFWVFFLGMFFVVGIWFSDEQEMVGGGNGATALVV